MTHLVLARKWRPRSFSNLVGQENVVRALTYLLEKKRLHHAWLFAGTRGVGKTTLSRILAKALNCNEGITANPCEQCVSCIEIDTGCFTDYLELDAASNRSVEEITQLLEQVIYTPNSGRFKVYVIDEVHMLSGHAFNAMLKVLEEPPKHVKFIFATTDPSKIPATILSRCLRFNLKLIPDEIIIEHLQKILSQENIEFEVPALHLIARAGKGSMRDALSLADQAINYSAGFLSEKATKDMLGTIEGEHFVSLLNALVNRRASEILQIANEISSLGLSHDKALSEFSEFLSKVAVEQQVPGTISKQDFFSKDIMKFASAVHPDAIHLFYTITIHSRSEITLAPDEHAGFVMTFLRMLSLLGKESNALDGRKTSNTTGDPERTLTSDVHATVPCPAEKPSSARSAAKHNTTFSKIASSISDVSKDDWPQFINSLPLTGLAHEFAKQSEWESVQGDTIRLRIGVKTFTQTNAASCLQDALSKYFRRNIEVKITDGPVGETTAFALERARIASRQEATERAVKLNPVIQSLIKDFDGYVVPGSIRHIDEVPPT